MSQKKRDFYHIAKESGASQDAFELSKLLEIVDRIKPEKILEIGVHRGLSIKAWREAWPAAFVVGVDSDFGPLKYTDFEQVQGDSHDPATKEKFSTVGQFDFIFIDGDHTLEGVRKDYEMYGSLVRPGGIMAFHDIMRSPERISYHAGVDCRVFFDELKNKHANIEIWNGLAGDNGPGIGVIFL